MWVEGRKIEALYFPNIFKRMSPVCKVSVACTFKHFSDLFDIYLTYNLLYYSHMTIYCTIHICLLLSSNETIQVRTKKNSILVKRVGDFSAFCQPHHRRTCGQVSYSCRSNFDFLNCQFTRSSIKMRSP